MMCSCCHIDAQHGCDIPDRGDYDTDYRVYHFCPLCLDEMLEAFPIYPTKLLHRELTGYMPRLRERYNAANRYRGVAKNPEL